MGPVDLFTLTGTKVVIPDVGEYNANWTIIFVRETIFEDAYHSNWVGKIQNVPIGDYPFDFKYQFIDLNGRIFSGMITPGKVTSRLGYYEYAFTGNGHLDDFPWDKKEGYRT